MFTPTYKISRLAPVSDAAQLQPQFIDFEVNRALTSTPPAAMRSLLTNLFYGLNHADSLCYSLDGFRTAFVATQDEDTRNELVDELVTWILEGHYKNA